MSQQSISFLYTHSKVVFKGSESEGTCRALHEGIVCGCVAVYYKNHKGALVDYSGMKRLCQVNAQQIFHLKFWLKFWKTIVNYIVNNYIKNI